MSPELRPYQVDIIAAFERTVAAGQRRIIIVMPTGSGKTVVAAEIARKHQRVLFLAHRREIISHTCQKLFDVELDHGVIQAGYPSRLTEPIQVASVQTLHSRAVRGSRIALREASLIIVDECHHATAETWRKIIGAYPNAILLGMTATPCRGDGRGLGGIFDALIESPQVSELIDVKFLVGTRVYAPTTPDLAGVRVQAGDWVESQLAERMDRPKLVGDIIEHWHRLAEGRKTVVFASGVQHSLHIRDEFLRSEVRAAHIDGATPKLERDSILRQLAQGDLDVVTNCMVLTEGWDMPDIGCCILARPTRKMGLYRQMIGRVLRPAPGKVDAIVIDHSGAVHRHGFVEDRIEWALSPDKHAGNSTHAHSPGEHGSRLVECTKCGALRVGGEACRHCGFKPAPPPKPVQFIDEDLAIVARNGTAASYFTSDQRKEFFAQLRAIAQLRGYKDGWTAHKFRERFGAFPPWEYKELKPATPSEATFRWVKSRNIAWAKSRELLT
jgi:superfamily II DNA or RNA helicase